VVNGKRMAKKRGINQRRRHVMRAELGYMRSKTGKEGGEGGGRYEDRRGDGQEDKVKRGGALWWLLGEELK